jgi:hypothetical protein
MQINEYTVKISLSKFPINQELKLEEDVELNIKGEVLRIEDTSNYDGTVDRCFIIKGIEGVKI